MTGYQLTAKMRKIRRRHPLTSTEQALFYELVAICNEDEWAESFFVASAELCHALSITENTLNNARLRLIQVGLISYNSGKSKRQFSEYSFVTSVSKIDTDKSTNVGTDKSTNVGTDDENKLRTNINSKTKRTKNKTKKSKSHSENEFSVLDEIENLKKEIPDKPDKPEDNFYKKFVSVWFDFYQQQFSLKPTFGNLEGNKLKSIMKKLKLKCEEFQMDWDVENAESSFNQFLQLASSDRWLKENFQLAILDSRFDSIILKSKNKNGINQTAASAVFDQWK